jgi:CRP-like cAMP-binding protein
MRDQAVALEKTGELEDVLAYLPRKTPVEFKKGETIYTEADPANGIYLILRGSVLAAQQAGDNIRLSQVFGTDELFGYSGFLRLTGHLERTIALQNTLVMYWTTDQLEELMLRNPRLGVALIQRTEQYLARLQERMQSCAFEKTTERTIRVFLDLAERIGKAGSDGSVELPPITQVTLSQCVGTSREIVTVTMNELRRRGSLRYSRRGIFVYPDALRQDSGQGYNSRRRMAAGQ